MECVLGVFTPEGIACIANAVGMPLYLDKATEEQRRVTFARVCVESIEGATPLKCIEVDTEELGIISVRVEYPWGREFALYAKHIIMERKNVKGQESLVC